MQRGTRQRRPFIGQKVDHLLHNFRQMLRIFRLATGPPAAGLPARVRRRFPKIRLPPRRSRSAMTSTTSALRWCSQAMRRSGVLSVACGRMRGSRRSGQAPRVGIRVADSSVSATRFHTPVARPPSLLLSPHLDRKCGPAPNPIPLRADEGLILDCGGPLCQKDARLPQMGGRASSRPRLKSDRPEAIFQSARCSDIGSARIGCRACRGKG
jgi:hypothetical protein